MSARIFSGATDRPVSLAAAAKQIQNGAKPRVEVRSRKPTRVAMQEVLNGTVSWDVMDEVRKPIEPQE